MLKLGEKIRKIIFDPSFCPRDSSRTRLTSENFCVFPILFISFSLSLFMFVVLFMLIRNQQILIIILVRRWDELPEMF